MEEVNNRGYHVQFEKTGLNLVQSKMALQKLAYFHAASVILMENVSSMCNYLETKNYILVNHRTLLLSLKSSPEERFTTISRIN